MDIPRFLHICLIKYSIYEIRFLYKYFKFTHPEYKDFYRIEDYHKFNEKTKKNLENSLKLQRLKNELTIHNIKTYCENYPSDIINDMFFMKEYKGHGYNYKIVENFNTILEHIGKNKK